MPKPPVTYFLTGKIISPGWAKIKQKVMPATTIMEQTDSFKVNSVYVP
jgi:hypothetical protein